MSEITPTQPADLQTADTEQEKSPGGPKFSRYMTYAVIGLVIIVVLPFIIGLIFALLSASEPTALRFGMIRDVFIIILSLQSILIIVSLAILIMQVSRLIALLQSEIKPIIENTKETVETARGTARFVSKNAAGPLIGMRAFGAGFTVFVREAAGIRRAIRPSRRRGQGANNGTE